MEEPTDEGSEGYCRWAAGEFGAGRDFALLLTLRGTGEIVGASGLHDPDWTVPAFEIGWWGRTGYLRQGLITEGARAVLKWGFGTLKARRIHATVDEENAASWRLCERIGMECEGRRRHVHKDPDGRLSNARLYAAVR
jgi:RimJ/RimL family protein N-acetyltransferase